MEGITYDEVYEIAAEVCEEMITKFLRNLVKLVPAGEDTVEEIQEAQYRELRELRQNKLQESTSRRDAMKSMLNKSNQRPQRQVLKEDYEPDEYVTAGNEEDDEFAAIAHEGGNTMNSDAMNDSIDDALKDIHLDSLGIHGLADTSGAEDSIAGSIG